MSFLNHYKEMDSDVLRAEVESYLRWAVANNHITLSDLEERLVTLYNTDDKETMLKLIEDLPAKNQENSRTSSSDSDSSRFKTYTNKDVRPEHLYALLGSQQRKGQWTVPSKIEAGALLGSIELDFTQAEFTSPRVVISCAAILGSVELRVPEGVRVQASGVPILGSIDNRTTGNGDGPVIEIKGVALLGSIEAKPPRRKKKDKRSRRNDFACC